MKMIFFQSCKQILRFCDITVVVTEINYGQVITSAFIGSGLELIRVPELLWFVNFKIPTRTALNLIYIAKVWLLLDSVAHRGGEGRHLEGGRC